MPTALYFKIIIVSQKVTSQNNAANEVAAAQKIDLVQMAN
jgi:hypothetical protein